MHSVEIPLIIGKTSSNEEVKVNLINLPHLFISYTERRQLISIIRSITDQIKVNSEQVRITIFDDAEIPNDNQDLRQFESHVIRKKKRFIEHVYKEHLSRLKSYNKKEHSKPIGANHNNQNQLISRSFYLVIIRDIFKIILSKKKDSIKLIELLIDGKATGIHLILGSPTSYRNILMQLVFMHPAVEKRVLIQGKSADIKIPKPLGAELIITAENMVFYKEGREEIHNRYYPIF